MSTQNPTMTLVYQKNLRKEKITAYWLVNVNGQDARQVFLKPKEHGRQSRKQAFLDAFTWTELTLPGVEIKRIDRHTYSNRTVKTDWQELSQELEEVEVVS